MQITTIIILILIIIACLLVIGLYIYFKNKITDLSMRLFGTNNIFEGFKKQELEYRETPKSVSSLDSVLIPTIRKDFPFLNIEDLKSKAQNIIIEYYRSLENRKLEDIENSSATLKNKILTAIEDLPSYSISYNNLNFHRSVINSYHNKNGSCNLVVQVSYEYIKKYKDTEIKEQQRMNVEFIYIYDNTNLDNEYGVSLNCPNCGAPVKSLGNKSCSYCGTAIIENVDKVWIANNITIK